MSTNLTSVVQGFSEGSKTVEACFTCLSSAKPLRFFGIPSVKLSLAFKGIVESLSSHQPFQIVVEILGQRDDMFHCF